MRIRRGFRCFAAKTDHFLSSLLIAFKHCCEMTGPVITGLSSKQSVKKNQCTSMRWEELDVTPAHFQLLLAQGSAFRIAKSMASGMTATHSSEYPSHARLETGLFTTSTKVVFGCSHEAARSGHERGLSLLCKQAKQTRSACVALIRFL